jgi:hypothetical protein
VYKSALIFISILKQKNLYIVGCVECDIWDITAYFLLPKLKYHYEKKEKIIPLATGDN